MKSLKNFERHCLKLHEEFEKNCANAKSLDERFEIFNLHVEKFKKLALKIKPHINSLNISEYNKRIDFFINVCSNEMHLHLRLGTACYENCTSKAECLAVFRKRLYKMSRDMRIPDFFSLLMVTSSKEYNFKMVSLRHALNSERVTEVDGIIVPYYSIFFDSNITNIIENCLRIRLQDVIK